MPTLKKGARLDGSLVHQKLILANLTTQLIEHHALTTTEAKTKVLQPYFEKLMTKTERDDLHAHQTVAKKITSKEAVYMLFDEIVPEPNSEHNGGYTRLIRVDNRKGNNALLVRIEIILERVEKKATVKAAEVAVTEAAEKAEEPTKDKAAKAESTEAEAPETE